MTTPFRLAEAFISRAQADTTLLDRQALGSSLAELIAAARARWPDVAFDDAELAGALAERWAPEETQAQAFGPPPFAVELFLVQACLRADAAAVRHFDAESFRHVDGVLRRLGLRSADADDVKQEVRTRLLVGADDAKLTRYDGTGPLAHWVASVAGRTGLVHLRRRRASEPLEPDALLDDAPDPRLAALHARQHSDLKQAFQAAVAALPPRDRAVLSALIVDDRTVGDIAALYRIHRVTASRWIADIRRTLLRATRRQLKRRLALDDAGLDSAMRLVDSQLDMSLYRLLAGSGRSPASGE